MKDVYREFFPDHQPSRSALGANGLAQPEFFEEIECVAEVGQGE